MRKWLKACGASDAIPISASLAATCVTLAICLSGHCQNNISNRLWNNNDNQYNNGCQYTKSLHIYIKFSKTCGINETNTCLSKFVDT